MKNKVIKVDYLARVEGEGSIYIKIKNDEVKDVQFKIFEPPRFFEAFLRGRQYTEAPDITARICGICPVAYQMSSIQAMENALEVNVGDEIKALRRLLYCGEWIESHVLHIFMLHAPDFLGYQDAILMAKDLPDAVTTALELKKLGNDLMVIIGGREIHPVNCKVGGFYKAPAKAELYKMMDKLVWARDKMAEMTKFLATLDFPDFEQEYEFVALSHPTEYAINEGRIISSKGIDIDVRDYDMYFEEEHAHYSNALQSRIKDRGTYMTGPIARFNLNYDKLTPLAKKTAEEINLKPEIKNPFKSILARAIETIFAYEEAIRLIEEYKEPEKPSVKIDTSAAIGYGCTEAPRGILYHRYRLSDSGTIKDAKIVPPTSQNQKQMERDLHDFIPKFINLPDDQLLWKCEQAVRNYDPCISCATHFLKLNIERE